MFYDTIKNIVGWLMETIMTETRKKIVNFFKNGKIMINLPFSLNKLSPIQLSALLLLEGTSFVDLYKKANYLRINHELRDAELLYLPLIDSITSVEQIHTICLQRPVFMQMMLQASLDFEGASLLKKTALVKSLPEEDVNHLIVLFPPFEEEIKQYRKPFELEKYFLYVETIRMFYEKHQTQGKLELIIKEISSFIKQLYGWNTKEAEDTILKLALIDYQATQTLDESILDYLENGKKKRIGRIRLLLNGEKEDIIKKALTDEYYLEELVEIYYFVRKIYDKEEAFEEALNLSKLDEKVREKVGDIRRI